MKKTKALVAVGIVALLMAFAIQGLAAERHEVSEKVTTHGRINWSQGVIFAKGKGIAPDATPQESEKTSAVRNAQVDAYANLLEAIKGVRIDSSTQVKDILKSNNTVQPQLETMVRQAKVVKREYLSDGLVEVTLAFELTGGFAQLILPTDIMPVPEIKAIAQTPAEEKKPPVPESIVYTGLVIDTRGLKGRPAMSPRITDENGEEAYGSVFVSREFAVQQGMAGYGKDLKWARSNSRVSDNPLTVRALKVVGQGRCDFIVSNADAWKVRSASENLLFLKKCRVMIVLD